MNLANERCVIVIRTKNSNERYVRDGPGWVKVSTRGQRFKATAEQVLNHLLPVLAGVKPNLSVEVEHHEAAHARKGAGAGDDGGGGSERERTGRWPAPRSGAPKPARSPALHVNPRFASTKSAGLVSAISGGKPDWEEGRHVASDEF